MPIDAALRTAGDAPPARSHLAARLLALAGLCACDVDQGSGASTLATHAWSLVRADAWETTEPALDPEPSHRPDPFVCPMRPWHAEGRGIEIDTTACNYVSLSQPMRDDLHEGDAIQIGAWWSTLASDEPGMGHFALYVGDEPVWDEWVAIPGPAGVRSFEIASPVEAEADTPITVHLHNHGYNTWRLEQAQVRAQTTEAR